jgi:hypothetical protein
MTSIRTRSPVQRRTAPLGPAPFFMPRDRPRRRGGAVGTSWKEPGATSRLTGTWRATSAPDGAGVGARVSASVQLSPLRRPTRNSRRRAAEPGRPRGRRGGCAHRISGRAWRRGSGSGRPRRMEARRSSSLPRDGNSPATRWKRVTARLKTSSLGETWQSQTSGAFPAGADRAAGRSRARLGRAIPLDSSPSITGDDADRETFFGARGEVAGCGAGFPPAPDRRQAGSLRHKNPQIRAANRIQPRPFDP